MKKLICAMLLCTLITAVSCGKSNDNESSAPESSEITETTEATEAEEPTEEPTEAAETTAVPATTAAVTKAAETTAAPTKPSAQEQSPVGEWFSEEVGGVFVFGSDGILKLQIDVSEEMTIDQDGVVHMSDDIDDLSPYCSYDGETFVFSIEDVMEMMTLKRRGEPSPGSVYGSYDLVSGMLYDNFVDQFGEAEGRYGMIVGRDSLVCDIVFCSYKAENGVITLIGDESSLFGSSGDDTVMNFDITDDTMILHNAGEKVILTRK